VSNEGVTFCSFVEVAIYFSPYLLRDAMPESYDLGEHIIASSSKLIAIDKLLADILPTGERVLIFSVRFLCLFI
jgi:hypothetical protein